ncbi:hypothetical protein [Marinobacter xestospongiae]|uniref:hypothetical protein n=1 Tax=Marinobacter xestospongiae TaxID=994319 RepID=UPI00200382D3|nr:hypothetical protein [Marinobacter xestospongiae]MCK7567211.1 hypothetical protein [Marinobacter xestospongiae]
MTANGSNWPVGQHTHRILMQSGRLIGMGCLLASLALPWQSAHAGAREQAQRMHERLTGVRPSAGVLETMALEIQGGNAQQAAYTAMDDRAFYDVTLKNFAAPWTNEAQSSFVPLNDYTATVIGVVRDERDFRTILYDDILYVGDGALNLPPYAIDNNDHYRELEAGGYSLQDHLDATTQSSRNGLPSTATAGVMTSRAAAQAFFSAGTNRAMFRFTLMNHLCNDLEQVNDVTRPPDRIRQDVSRSPGGDSRVFLNNCVGCHSGMDPLAQAFAYYDFEYDADNDPDGNLGRLVYNTVGATDPDTGTRVQGKYLINAANFEPGYITRDDRWDNYWRAGPNRRLGWDSAQNPEGGGYGAKSMGQELAHSDAFAECQAKKVFRTVCLRDPVDGADRSQIATMVSNLRASGFKLKRSFADSAVYCMGD